MGANGIEKHTKTKHIEANSIIHRVIFYDNHGSKFKRIFQDIYLSLILNATLLHLITFVKKMK